MKRGVLICLIFFLLLGSVSAATYNATAGTTTIYECGDIVEAGTYTVNQTINATATICINVSSSDVVLDGNSSLVFSYNAPFQGKGIYLSEENNITITNLTIGRFYSGIYVYLSNSKP